jgi:hypothetical protein
MKGWREYCKYFLVKEKSTASRNKNLYTTENKNMDILYKNLFYAWEH